MTDREEKQENIWTCRKCGLLRSSKFMHIHGVPLPDWKLKKIREIDDAKSQHSDASVQ